MFLLRNKKNIDTFWLKKCLIQSYDFFKCTLGIGGYIFFHKFSQKFWKTKAQGAVIRSNMVVYVQILREDMVFTIGGCTIDTADPEKMLHSAIYVLGL